MLNILCTYIQIVKEHRGYRPEHKAQSQKLNALRNQELSALSFQLWTIEWWRWTGSNRWPPACKAGALPAELHPQRIDDLILTIENSSYLLNLIFDLQLSIVNRAMVGLDGVEPSTSRLSGVRSNQAELQAPGIFGSQIEYWKPSFTENPISKIQNPIEPIIHIREHNLISQN